MDQAGDATVAITTRAARTGELLIADCRLPIGQRTKLEIRTSPAGSSFELRMSASGFRAIVNRQLAIGNAYLFQSAIGNRQSSILTAAPAWEPGGSCP